jgi:hypothetical protein
MRPSGQGKSAQFFFQRRSLFVIFRLTKTASRRMIQARFGVAE